MSELASLVASLPVEQQAVMKAILGFHGAYGATVIVVFPDGHELEVRRYIGFTFVRESGADKWEGTLLRSLEDVAEWVCDAQLRVKE